MKTADNKGSLKSVSPQKGLFTGPSLWLTERVKYSITIRGKKTMDVIREFKKPSSNQIVLDIPEKLVETELEILIIPVNGIIKKKKSAIEKRALFEKLCGLWEDREDLTLESIRNKAWKRN